MPPLRPSLALNHDLPHDITSPRNCPRDRPVDARGVAKPSNIPLPCNLDKPRVLLLDVVCSFRTISSHCKSRLAIVCLPATFDRVIDDENEPYVAPDGEYQVECATHGVMGRLLLNKRFSIILYRDPFANGCLMLAALKKTNKNTSSGTFDDFQDVQLDSLDVLKRGTRFLDRPSMADGRFPPSYVVEIAATLDLCVEAQQARGLTNAQCFSQYFPNAVVLAETMPMFDATMRLWQDASEDLKHAFISAGMRREGDFRVFLKNAEREPRMSLARIRMHTPMSWYWQY